MDYILLDGDMAQFLPSFGAATVVVRPGTLQGSGPAKCNGKPVCVDGDEKQLQVSGCMYMSGSFSIPGTGTLKIDSLGGDQKAQHTRSGGKEVLLKGGMFQAKFEVQSPAQQPNPPGPPLPDPMSQYSGGQGQFITTNTKFKGT